MAPTGPGHRLVHACLLYWGFWSAFLQQRPGNISGVRSIGLLYRRSPRRRVPYVALCTVTEHLEQALEMASKLGLVPCTYLELQVRPAAARRRRRCGLQRRRRGANAAENRTPAEAAQGLAGGNCSPDTLPPALFKPSGRCLYWAGHFGLSCNWYITRVRGPNTCENRYITDRLLLGELCTCEPLANGFDGLGTYMASPGGQE